MTSAPRFRTVLQPGDRDGIRRLVDATGFFTAEEALVAVELIDEAAQKGYEGSGYAFVFAETPDGLLGYACYGPIPATVGSFDLYWIVVDPAAQGRGLGQALMKAVEREVATRNGARIWVDTSERPQYASTRAFYRRCGYTQSASLADFYAPGDGKAIFCKALAPRR